MSYCLLLQPENAVFITISTKAPGLSSTVLNRIFAFRQLLKEADLRSANLIDARHYLFNYLYCC